MTDGIGCPHFLLEGFYMKLNDIRPFVETSGELEEQFFSIQDQGMIFDILRNKMYSNPILAICREISCNARDAHREVGKTDVPVEITLPNSLEPFYKIKDYGPGISPDRMSNIFIKYTASTKRDDNIQTGGFGLGAKTPFSYSDTFTIKTVVDGIEYNYACFIDETKVGKLALLNQAASSEPNGTEIIIPVKPIDFRAFTDNTELATRHWEVLPKIKGGNITYIKNEFIISGTNWAIAKSTDWNKSVKLIIDGIEYPVDLTALRGFANTKVLDASRSNIFLYFNIGELSLSASREQIYLDKPTQKIIADRFSLVVSEIKKNISNKINSFPNLWEANIYYATELYANFHSLDFLGNLDWKGYPLSSASLYLDCTVYYYSKGHYTRKTGMDPNRIKRSHATSLTFGPNSKLFINDTNLREPTPKHVKQAFENDPTLKNIQLVCPNDKTTLDVLNKKANLDKMGPELLSSITSATGRAPTSGNKSSAPRLLMFKFDMSVSAFRQVPYSSVEDDKNKKVICRLYKEYNERVVRFNKTSFNHVQMLFLAKQNPKISFYGVDADIDTARLDEDYPDFVDIEKFVTDYLKSITNFVEIKYALTQQYNIESRLLSAKSNIEKLIEDKNSLFLKKIKMSEIIGELVKNAQLLQFYEAVNKEIPSSDLKDFVSKNPDYDLIKLGEKINKKYPLLSALSIYNYAQFADPICQYINLIDKV